MSRKQPRSATEIVRVTPWLVPWNPWLLLLLLLLLTLSDSRRVDAPELPDLMIRDPHRVNAPADRVRAAAADELMGDRVRTRIDACDWKSVDTQPHEATAGRDVACLCRRVRDDARRLAICRRIDARHGSVRPVLHPHSALTGTHEFGRRTHGNPRDNSVRYRINPHDDVLATARDPHASEAGDDDVRTRTGRDAAEQGPRARIDPRDRVRRGVADVIRNPETAARESKRTSRPRLMGAGIFRTIESDFGSISLITPSPQVATQTRSAPATMPRQPLRPIGMSAVTRFVAESILETRSGR